MSNEMFSSQHAKHSIISQSKSFHPLYLIRHIKHQATHLIWSEFLHRLSQTHLHPPPLHHHHRCLHHRLHQGALHHHHHHALGCFLQNLQLYHSQLISPADQNKPTLNTGRRPRPRPGRKKNIPVYLPQLSSFSWFSLFSGREWSQFSVNIKYSFRETHSWRMLQNKNTTRLSDQTWLHQHFAAEMRRHWRSGVRIQVTIEHDTSTYSCHFILTHLKEQQENPANTGKN